MREANRARAGKPGTKEPGAPEGAPRTARHNTGTKKRHVRRRAPLSISGFQARPLNLQRQADYRAATGAGQDAVSGAGLLIHYPQPVKVFWDKVYQWIELS